LKRRAVLPRPADQEVEIAAQLAPSQRLQGLSLP